MNSTPLGRLLAGFLAAAQASIAVVPGALAEFEHDL
jgi:hypothetical protein